MGRRKERTPALRETVVDSALALLEEGGVARFTARRLAAGADTSVAAVYELFGDKAGVVREVFFLGFRMLGHRLGALAETDDTRADLLSALGAVRDFVRERPALAQVMFSHPFADFDPGPEEMAAGASVREALVARVRRTQNAGLVVGNPTDVAHVLLALVQGLAGQEGAGWLGTTRGSVERRWWLGVDAVIDGLARTHPTHPHRAPAGARPRLTRRARPPTAEER